MTKRSQVELLKITQSNSTWERFFMYFTLPKSPIHDNKICYFSSKGTYVNFEPAERKCLSGTTILLYIK